MNRPAYESDWDRAAEESVCEALVAAWRCSVRKLPLSYRLDYALLRGYDIVGWLEIKVRKKRYDTLILSAHKWMDGLRLSGTFGKPFIIAVQFPDQLLYAKALDFAGVALRWGGRSDREDWQDTEPVVYLPIDVFQPIQAPPPQQR